MDFFPPLVFQFILFDRDKNKRHLNEGCLLNLEPVEIFLKEATKYIFKKKKKSTNIFLMNVVLSYILYPLTFSISVTISLNVHVTLVGWGCVKRHMTENVNLAFRKKKEKKKK